MTEAEKRRLEDRIDIISTGSNFVGKIAGCADGEQAKMIQSARSKGIWSPDVGPLCLGLLEHTADADINPEITKKRPDKQLLAYHAVLASDKGFEMNGANAQQALKLYVKVGEQPETRNLVAGAVPVSAPGNTQEVWSFTPGNAFIATFIDTVRNGRAGKPVAPASTTYDALIPTLNQCFNDAAFQIRNNVKMGPCSDAGKQAGALYLAKKTPAASR